MVKQIKESFQLRRKNKLKPLNCVKADWPCWKSLDCNLVYWVNYKCASTLYRGFFHHIGWQETDSSQINWDSDYVFSYIRKPLIKQRKGIVENFFRSDTHFAELVNPIMNNPTALALLAQITCLDGHTETIQTLLGDNARCVDWIPIDTAFDHKSYTVNLLKQHNITVTENTQQSLINQGYANKSTKIESEMFQKLMSITTPPHILRYVDFDQCIYDQVIWKNKNA
jgi:hypothetical protein